ncbi:OsmC family protein [Steroidobacter cummioxidans]|uniref:OsmC family protein n=1 Tax=Steroidobacter cummioxidans TaxID=1803913 RepID=UPI000E324BAA|nr:OsmC family protein [Steroidobacter cummioxidans]
MAPPRIHVTVSETAKSPFAVRIEMGSHVLAGDEPVDAGGGGLGPSPFELLSAALAECTAMTVRWYARQQGWPVEHVAVSVDYGKELLAGASTPRDVFEKTIAIRGPQLTDEQRKRLLDVAARCPVQRVLEGSPLIKAKLGTPPDQVTD